MELNLLQLDSEILVNPNTCAEVNQCLFLFTSAQERVFARLKFLKQLVLAKYE